MADYTFGFRQVVEYDPVIGDAAIVTTRGGSWTINSDAGAPAPGETVTIGANN